MARVKCDICGNYVNTTAGNYVLANGLHQHKKCPNQDTLSDQEKKDYKELTDAIEWACVHKNLSTFGLNWKLITSQMKDLKLRGYSYKDQLYALKYVVDKDNGYWGYGRIVKFITHAMEQKKREDEYVANKNKMERELYKHREEDISDKERESKIEMEKIEKLYTAEGLAKSASKPNFMNF